MRLIDYSFMSPDISNTLWPKAVDYAMKRRATAFNTQINTVVKIWDTASEIDVYLPSVNNIAFDIVGYRSNILLPMVDYIESSSHSNIQEQFNASLVNGLSLFVHTAVSCKLYCDLVSIDTADIRSAVWRIHERFGNMSTRSIPKHLLPKTRY